MVAWFCWCIGCQYSENVRLWNGWGWWLWFFLALFGGLAWSLVVARGHTLHSEKAGGGAVTQSRFTKNFFQFRVGTVQWGGTGLITNRG